MYVPGNIKPGSPIRRYLFIVPCHIYALNEIMSLSKRISRTLKYGGNLGACSSMPRNNTSCESSRSRSSFYNQLDNSILQSVPNNPCLVITISSGLLPHKQHQQEVQFQSMIHLKQPLPC